MRLSAVLAAALFAVVIASAPAASQQTGSAVGERAPSLMLETLDGQTLDLAEYIGKTPVVLHFFADWCSLCGAQIPSLRTAVARYGATVKFIGVAVSASQSVERARRYARTHGLTHDLVYDATGEATDAYDVPTTSYVVVIDSRGVIVFTGSGADLDIAAAARRVVDPGG